MKIHNLLLWLSITLLLTACTSAPKVYKNRYVTEAESLLSNVWYDGKYDRASALAALQQATLADRADLQWRASLELCQQDIEYCDDALQLAHQYLNRESVFATYIAVFLNNQNEDSLAAAERFASSPQQKSLVFVLKGTSNTLDNTILSPSERALALYHIGKQQNHRQSLILASQEFLKLDNIRGSADANFLAAKIALTERDQSQARQLAYRSKRLLLAIDEPELATQVDTWIEANLNAR